MNTKNNNMEKIDRKMIEQIPTYLENYVKECRENEFTQITLHSSAGNEMFEVWYYGNLLTVKGEEQPYIVETDIAPEIIVAKDVATGEEIVIHDGSIHGYNNMFCDEYDTEVIKSRTLKQYPIPASKLVIELTCSIDYEEDKEDYGIDDDGYVTLIDGRKMLWEDVKRNGMDFLGISYQNENGDLIQFYDKELA